MNLNMIQPKNETEDLLLSITKNCETLIDQTHRKAEETLEFKKIKPRETFHFKPPIQVKGDWGVGLVDLEVNNSIFNITEENNKFELSKFPDEKAGGISYTKVKDEIEKDLDISDITAVDLQHDIIGPIIIDEYREQVTKRMKDGGYMNILSGYTRSVFQDFESYLRTEVDLVEDHIRLVLDKYSSSFIIYELDPGFCTFKDLSKAFFTIHQHENPSPDSEVLISLDDISKKSKLVLRPGIIAIKFDEKSFFSTILGFNNGWDFKHYNQYISQKIESLSSTNKIHLKCDFIDGSVVNGTRQPIVSSFVLDKPSGYKVFCKPETIHFKKINKSVLNTNTFYLEDDNKEEVNFNGETIIFTLQMIKIYYIMFTNTYNF